MKKITVIGGGNSAHTLIPLLSKTGLEINILTRKPKQWKNEILLDYMKPSGEVIDTWKGKISKISSSPKAVIPDSDIVILCMPVNAYRKALHAIAPHINPQKKVYVGTVYGQGGFNWMVKEIADKFNLTKLVTYAIGLIPWICRTEKYGQKGIVYGAKPLNLAAVSPQEEFDTLNEILLSKMAFEWFGQGKFHPVRHFISLTMCVDNQIIHTSRMYGLYLEHGGEWLKLKDVPYFYRDFSEKSAEILAGLDEDYARIRSSLKQKYPNRDFKWMMDYIEQDNITNDKNNSTVLDTFKNSKTLGAIKTPVVHDGDKWVLNKKHRFFYDDVFYGLCIAKWFAQKLEVKTPNIDNILYWAQDYLGENIINDNELSFYSELERNPLKYGVPEAYGYLKIDDVVD